MMAPRRFERFYEPGFFASLSSSRAGGTRLSGFGRVEEGVLWIGKGHGVWGGSLGLGGGVLGMLCGHESGGAHLQQEDTLVKHRRGVNCGKVHCLDEAAALNVR